MKRQQRVVSGSCSKLIGASGGLFINRCVCRIGALFTAASILPFAGASAQTYSVIDYAFSNSSVAAINAHGISAGTLSAARNEAFFSDGATFSFIPSLRMDDQNGATGINDNGLVTGWSYSGMPGFETSTHAYVYNTATGSLTDLGTLPGLDYSVGNAINASGQVTGYAGVAGGKVHAFRYTSGRVTDLGTLPGGTSSHGNAINDSGLVVGGADTAHGDKHAVMTEGNSLIDLGTLAGGMTGVGYTSEAFALNNAGQIVGSTSVLPSGSHAFRYSGGTMTDLGTLGGSNSVASGLNDSGQVVGQSDIAMPPLPWLSQSAFLYANAVMTDLNTLIDPSDPLIGKVHFSGAAGINGNGWIIANGQEGDITGGVFSFTAFLLVPLHFSPRSLAFSSQGVGTTGPPQPVTITNTGTGPFALTKIATTSGFSQTNHCPAALPTGAGCTIQVASSPVTFGYQSGALNITSGSATLVVKVNGAAFIPVELKASATTVTVGGPVTLTWTSTSLATCSATGGAPGDGWAGSVSTSGEKSVIEKAAGSYTYQVTCSMPGGSDYAYVKVQNNSAPPSTSGGGGGGGGMDWLTLGASLGCLFRRTQECIKVLRANRARHYRGPRSSSLTAPGAS